MLSKVKKLGSKLFGDSNESAEELRSSGSLSKMKTAGSLKPASSSDHMEVDHHKGPAGHLASSVGHIGVEASSGSKGHLVLPPVQVSQNSSTSQASGHSGATASPGMSPSAIAGLMAPTGGSGRRKSTPAALDMALRTAEGKAAIEELMNSAGKKQMVFGQYFGSNSKASPAASGAVQSPPSADKGSPSRFGKAAAMANNMYPPSLGKAVQPIIEDDDSHHEPATKIASHHAKPSTPASTSHSPAAHHAQTHAAAAGPSSADTAAHASSSSRAVTTPQKRPAETAASSAPAPAAKAATQVEEVPPGRQTKILAVAQQLPTGMARKYWSLSDYSVLRKMYTGYASTVYQATCKKSLEQVALKVYHMENLCELNHYQVYREIRVHASLSHQNIIGLYCAFQEGNDVVMVQEYAEGGDLYRLLHRNGGRLSERQAVEMVLHPFLLALHYLHTRGIMHRDIKPENVLFTEHRVLKLADFGLAIDLTEERAVTRAGTLDYMAPEVLRCPPKNLPQENKNNVNLHYNNSVDAWAVGVFAYELIVGFPPFAGESQLASVDKIIHATPEFPEKISELAKAFITAALKKHPGDRPNVMEMLHHPWIRSYQRRTSVIMPTKMVRRRSAVQGGPADGSAMPAQPDTLDNMTPEEIEKMIQKLQMSKQGLL